MTDSHYWELRVPASAETTDGLTNFLWEQGALGVVEESTAGATPILRAFFAASTASAVLRADLRTYLDALRELGFSVVGEASLAPLADANWAEAWREHFRPLRVGAGLLVAPSWDVPPADGRVTIVLDPGRAFGTGHHGTTRGCLEAIETLLDVARPATGLDLGTGSGILAIAAARLGVPEVLACDTDPDAVAAALANAGRNGVAGRVRTVVADAAALATAPAPVVLANLLASAHRALASVYRRLVEGGGALVLGGLLDAEADDVVTGLAGHGFRREAARSLEGWTSVILRHAPLHASA